MLDHRKENNNNKKPLRSKICGFILFYPTDAELFIFRLPQDEIQIKLSQSFDKEDTPVSKNEDDREKSADKLEKLENMQRKMLSRGACVHACAYGLFNFYTFFFLQFHLLR